MMHLYFETIGTKEINGAPYLLQRANVTTVRPFWIVWYNNRVSLSRLITLQKDGAFWYAYRCVPKNNDSGQPQRLPLLQFPAAYTPKNIDHLLPFQPRSMAVLCQSIIDHGSAVDGSDTGLGKTYVALAVCRELGLQPVIICKLAGISTWKRVCEYMGVKPYAICNWEFAKTGKVPFIKTGIDDYNGEKTFTWKVPDTTIILFDEAHVAAVKTSQNYSLYISSFGIPSITITATLTDRASRMDGFFHVLKVMEKSKFAAWIKGRVFENRYGEDESITDLDDMKEINKVLFPYHGFRLSYSDPDIKKYFPEAVYQTELITLSDEDTVLQNKLYQELLLKIERLKVLGRQADLLVADLRYRQQTELMKVPALVEITEDLLSQRKSVCIFVNFRESLFQLSKALKTKSLIYGAQDRDKLDREKIVADFQSNKERMIVCMGDAGGQSISLHDLEGEHQRISLICPTYNPIHLRQIMGRTYRAETKSVPVIKLVYAADTIEEKVSLTVARKIGNISALNQGDLFEPDIFNLGVNREAEILEDLPGKKKIVVEQMSLNL
jgi:superfamily II DNA or RNA helicase